ncbi:MAG: hypothetical protein AAF830_00685 [Pseudomonadota bacterium]
MGTEIASTHFADEDYQTFRERLRKETATLKSWFDNRAFDYSDELTVGLELEAWLVDENALPAPVNDAFLKAAGHDDIVEELAAFNIEINAPPMLMGETVFSDTEAALADVWSVCGRTGDTIGIRCAMMGILPTVRDEMLQLTWMSDANRYEALNRELMHRRRQEPIHIAIAGQDELNYRCDHIMLEAGCTSLQAHLKINQEDSVRFYNAGVLAAAPLVAATANSPFLYGKSLWCETRIPAFEQATAVDGFRDKSGCNVRRVTLGTGYLRHSFLELFTENLSFPVLLPALHEDTDRLPHLKLQNGTVWRWVRPILGFDGQGTPHLRIEHRVMPAGPTLTDTIANLALCHGLMLALARSDHPPEEETPFEDAQANFYACAKDGLDARVRWCGRDMNVQSLLVEKLIPKARAALIDEGVSEADVRRYIDQIMMPRVRSGRTGAAWQRSYMECNTPNFQAFTERYLMLQETNAPVHTWEV